MRPRPANPVAARTAGPEASAEQTSPQRKRSHKAPHSSSPGADAITRDMNNVNNTLSKFVGGKQRSWMQSGGGDTAGVSASLRTSRLPSSTTSRHKPTSSVPTTTAHAVAASIPAPTAIPQCPLPELRQDIPPPAPVAQPSSCTSPSRPQPAMSSQESEHGLPSPAPSHSPPTMQHRQLGQSADTNASGSLQTSREPAQTSVPTNNASGGAHVRIGISASPSAAAAGRNSVEQMGTQNGRKRSRDTSGEEACSGPNKRTMGNFAVPTAVSSTALPQQPPPFRRPSVATQPLPRPQPPRLINLEPLQVLNSVSPPSTQSPVNYSPCITAPPGYHGTASPVMQHMPSSVQSPVTQNFSPLQTPLPSPGQSPVQHNFTVSLASPAQLLNSITNFAMQFGGNTGRALTTGDINRLNIMRDAISKDDWSFMIAHQIYIARTLCTGSDVDAWAGGDVSGFGTVSGWEALKYYFRDNNELSGACLKFLLDFPLSLTTGYLTHPGPSAIVQQLRNLLSNGYKSLILMREHSIRHMTVIETTRIERHLRFNSPVLVSLVATKIRDDVQMVWKTAEIARANQGAQQTQQQIQQAQQQTQQQPQQLVRESGMATSPQQMTANSPLQTSPTAGYFSGPNQIPASYALILQQRAAAARHLQTSQYVTPQDHQNTHSYTLSRGPSLEHITTTQAQLSLGSHAQAAMSPPFQSPGLNPRPNNTFQAFPVPAGTRATDMQINHPSQLPPPLRRQSQEQLRFTVNQRQQPMPTQRTPIQALQYSMRSTQNPRQRVILPGPIQENILQAHLTSPKMTPTLTSSVHRKLHITVVGFAVRGLKLTGLCQTAAWHLSPAAEASLSKVSVSRPGEHPTRAMVAPGSLIYRLRCVEVKPGQKQPLSDSDWVVKETLWPRSVFIEINNKRIELRRKIQWGKDLPADITNHLSAGQNVLRVVHLNDGSTAQPNRPEYYISIEIFQCQDQDILKNTMFDQRYISAGESLKRIMQRLSNSDGMEDDDLVVASSNVYIPLTCPLSFQLINIPVRGKACAHLECFDYDTFMDARPKKRPGEPPIPDSYLCPHCRGDVRPGEMVIDGWIAEHLRRVRTEHKGVDVRGVVVEMDGRWKYRIEDKVMDDDETESECEEELRKMNGRTKKPEPEIICIDDD